MATLEPLPQATPSEILGLVETLAGYGGQMDLFELAGRARQEFGHVAQIVLAAEMLDFVDTTRRLVVLTPVGQDRVRADAPSRHKLFRQELVTLRFLTRVLDIPDCQGTVHRETFRA